MSRLSLPFLVLCATPVFAQKTNDLIRELQRDVATLQQDVKTLNSKFDEKMAVVSTLLQQALSEAGSASKGVAVIDRQLRDSLKEQQNLINAPVAALANKVDQMGQDYSALGENVKDVSNRMTRVQATLKEIQEAINVLAASAKPAVPPPAAPGPAPTAGGPPSGVSAEQVYLAAMKDKDGGNFDLALTEFQDFLKWFPSAELAPNAQYYIGECHYYKNDFDAAIDAFDKVIEGYPENNKTADAMYLKGRALLRQEKRSRAIQTFDELSRKYPNTEAARKARDLRKSLAPVTPTRGKKR